MDTRLHVISVAARPQDTNRLSGPNPNPRQGIEE
jgi:hypothetical protein